MDPLRQLIRAIPDFPAPGITFRDITPLLRDARGFAETIERLAAHYSQARIDLVAGIEARGFVFAAPLALALGAGFIPIRKAGKLPAEIIAREYALEYGSSRLELHRDAIAPGERVLLVDDVLATGGTAAAARGLIAELGGEPAGAAFVLEIAALQGRACLDGLDVYSLLSY